MSIQSEIERISGNVAAAYAAVEEMGGTVPEAQNSDRLAEAVRSIPTGGGIPSGCILIWSGAESAIPSGWALCNGENRTPDLRDKFVLGAGERHAVGEIGGSESVTLSATQMPSHTHVQRMRSYTNQNVLINMTYGNGPSTEARMAQEMANSQGYSPITTVATGGSQPHPNMPPYYALCYIMKL